VRTSYQYNGFRFVDDRQFGDNRLPVIPTHVVRAVVELGNDHWTIAPGVEWIPRGAWADYANSFRAGGYALLNVTGSVRVMPSTELFADIRNLSKRKAAGDISAVIDYAALSPAQRSIFYPVERRGFFVGLRSTLGRGR
jgi:iron complex outermembrane receptor protein